jgi:hypothetical protein
MNNRNIENKLIEIMISQLESPYKVGGVRQSEIIRYKLGKINPELAFKYWTWVCNYKKPGENTFSQVVSDIQSKLDKIDSNFVMPSWGTYGT